MSAADRVVVRTRDGAYKSVPRRVAAGLFASGRARPVDKPRPKPAATDPVEPVRKPATKTTADGLPVRPARRPTGEDDGPSMVLPVAPVRAVAPVRPVPEEPKPYATKAVWARYATALGVVVTDDMTKAQIQSAAREVAATPLDRLSQPAREGGRLVMPEDEPANRRPDPGGSQD